IHFGDDGEWSDNAVRDALWYLRKFGRRRPKYRQQGKWVCAKLSDVLEEKDIGAPMARCLFAMSCLPEMEELMSRESADCAVRAYTYLPSRRTAAVASLIAFLAVPTNLGLTMLRHALRAPSLPVGGFSIVEVRGRRRAREVLHRHEVKFDRQREYWMTAVVAATAARLIAEGRGVKPGVHFLVGAIDPVGFMEELRQAGVTHTQSATDGPASDGC